ncbi:MAG: DHH family phosphoesterase [Candidatus Nanoarchaeia archaeon]|nr:DHH family phosphoesterase [Candidatus Nanoarchaeia archaeon]
MEKTIKEFSELLLEKIKNKKIHIVSHYDTDGITSAAIFSKTLERLNKQFSLKIIKQLTKTEIDAFPKDKLIILLDLGSGSLKELANLNNEIFIIDHHEIELIDSKIYILNNHLFNNYENLCSAELSYLVSRDISEENKDLSNLAILGMIGDTMEKDINKTRNKIINEANVKIKRGLLIYPSTRPLDKALQYSARPFIPGITGDPKGTLDLLKEIEIEKSGKNYKSLIDLDEDEMKKLVTAIMLRLNYHESSKELEPTNLIGNLYLIKFLNRIEDAREISAIINACGRMERTEIALMLCLGNTSARKKAETVYLKYKQNIISGLKYIEENSKIQGNNYIIINGKDKIKDTIIGTLASILSFSSVYKEGTIIIAMAYNEDKIKISTRVAGRSKSNKSLRDLMNHVTACLGGESGGHKEAAGCVIKKNDEERFIELVKKKFEYETITV